MWNFLEFTKTLLYRYRENRGSGYTSILKDTFDRHKIDVLVYNTSSKILFGEGFENINVFSRIGFFSPKHGYKKFSEFNKGRNNPLFLDNYFIIEFLESVVYYLSERERYFPPSVVPPHPSKVELELNNGRKLYANYLDKEWISIQDLNPISNLEIKYDTPSKQNLFQSAIERNIISSYKVLISEAFRTRYFRGKNPNLNFRYGDHYFQIFIPDHLNIFGENQITFKNINTNEFYV